MGPTASTSSLSRGSHLEAATRLQLELAEQRFRSEVDLLRHELNATFQRELLVETQRLLFVVLLLAAVVAGVVIALIAVASR